MNAPRDFYEVLAEWEEAKRLKAHWTERERVLRHALITSTFTNPREGTNKAPLKDGRILVATHKLKREINPKVFPQVDMELGALGYNRPLSHFLKTTFDLKLTEYREAPEPVRAVLDRMITIKPASPDLMIKEEGPHD